MTNNKQNNGRTTKAVAVVVDFENMTLHEEIVEIAYTRTMEKAAKAVAEKLNVPTNSVTMKELVQPERQNIDDTAIVDISREIVNEMPEHVEDGFTVVPVTAYKYFGAAFGFSAEGKPIAEAIETESWEKFTKGTSATMLEAIAEPQFEENGSALYTVVFRQRVSVKKYAIVNSAEYQTMRYDF